MLFAGYAHRDVGDFLTALRKERVIQPKALGIDSFRGIYDHVSAGGDLEGLDLELEDLHMAAATIYYLILGPGTRGEMTAPEHIGSAATLRL